jgi:hypothetical protein
MSKPARKRVTVPDVLGAKREAERLSELYKDGKKPDAQVISTACARITEALGEGILVTSSDEVNNIREWLKGLQSLGEKNKSPELQTAARHVRLLLTALDTLQGLVDDARALGSEQGMALLRESQPRRLTEV